MKDTFDLERTRYMEQNPWNKKTHTGAILWSGLLKMLSKLHLKLQICVSFIRGSQTETKIGLCIVGPYNDIL